jgi:hypothetical protein
MKILHILRTQPDDLVQFLVRRTFEGETKIETPLYTGRVDYEKLVKDIFESDRVMCWW